MYTNCLKIQIEQINNCIAVKILKQKSILMVFHCNFQYITMMHYFLYVNVIEGHEGRKGDVDLLTEMWICLAVFI